MGEVKAVGNPQGNSWYTPRLLDSFSRVSGEEIHFESRTIQTGNSGGGLFDEQWNLVGMVIEDSPPTAKALQISTVIESIGEWEYSVRLVMNPSGIQRSIRVREYTKIPEICVQKGDEIIIDAQGSVSASTYQAYVSPEGKIGDLIPVSVQRNVIENKEIPDFFHASLIFRIAQENENIICDGLAIIPPKECEWHPYIPNTILKANKNGYLEFSVNDKEPSDNTGFYQVSVILNGYDNNSQ